MTKIAFVGLGAMGGPMAANLARKGVTLTVHDIMAQNVARVVEVGATAATDLAGAVCGADIVLTMLPATAHVHSVALSESGILDLMKPGGLYIDMSTISPTGTDRLIAACRARGLRFMDAPVGRLVSHAVAGEVLFMVGCDDEADFDEAKPLLDRMGTTILRCGKAGNGVRTKVVNNYQLLSIAQITAEALVLGAKLGLSVEHMKESNAQSTGSNGQMQVNFPSKVLIGDTAPGFTFDLAHKDMSLALEAAAEMRLGLPAGAAIQAVYGSARGTDYAGRDFSALVDYAAELAGIAPPRLGATD